MCNQLTGQQMLSNLVSVRLSGVRSSVKVSSSGSRGPTIVVGTRARQLSVPGGCSGTSALTGATKLMSRILNNSVPNKSKLSSISDNYTLLTFASVKSGASAHVQCAVPPCRAATEASEGTRFNSLPIPLTQIVQSSPIFF